MIRVGRGEQMAITFRDALRRLDAVGGNLTEATQRLLCSVEFRPGVQEAIKAADAYGVDIAPATLYKRILANGVAPTLRYLKDLAAIVDRASVLGLTCSQAAAASRLSRAGNDADAVLNDLEDQHRRRVRRNAEPCRVPVPPHDRRERANALAGCGCRRCQERLTRHLERYIGTMLASPLVADLEPEEASAVAHLELVEAVDEWPGGRNFAGWFSRRFETRVLTIYRSRKEDERYMLSLDAPVRDSGDGRLISLWERVPYLSRDTFYVVLDRLRIQDRLDRLTRERAARAAEYDMRTAG